MEPADGDVCGWAFGGNMIATLRRFAVLCLCMFLAACNAPRGAGFQSEVLAADGARDANGNPVYDFSVFAVTRSSLALLNAWPVNSRKTYSWIKHQVQPQNLVIAAGDVLSISIWDAEENSLLTAPGQRVAQLQNVEVGLDGRIFLPFVGNIKVSGMAPATARAQVEAMLLNTVPSAQVQLNVVPGRSNTANLVNGVRTPGVYPLADRNISLLTLIATAGGVSETLSNPQVRLFRGSQVYGISLDKLFDEPSFDIPIQGGDRILIEPDDRYFLSLGATSSEALHPFAKSEVSALDALAIIGGVTDGRANPQGVLILREYDSSTVVPSTVPGPAGPPHDRVVFTINLTTADGLFSAGNFMIQHGDLVYGTESPLGSASTILGIFSSAITAGSRISRF
jgi:polysaccharide export outer membrane protein